MFKNSDFFALNPVFTFKDYKENFKENALSTLRTQIWNYLKNGRIGAVGGGVYFTIPPGSNMNSYTPDRFLVASKLRGDAVVGYHSAFELLGYATQVFNTVYYITSAPKRQKSHKGITYQSVRARKALKGRPEFGAEKVVRSNVKISAANKERAFADCLDRPEYSGGFEEFFKCVEALPFLDLDFVFEYLLLLSKRNLFAKAGFVLEKYKNKFFFTEDWEQKFLSERSKSPSIAYLASRREAGRLIKKWNLIIPEKYLRQEAR
ncbi:hypothetical protein COY52_00700 [Candidatus Desantisbacteria bacterium CG_4_10_14_0_8_um_filter_48_22]|uniref:AbiEi antitoxin C-terminal domain-containing protein n=1 Tax=Candidatus Desantisbacteria bacterium CG_4_10_14_0_8_um_filter_48_22 TaxID=1974543 RepID=A0A2M7SF75_9BACT|nr:MAG: hypothetical protein COY52_00700 [Candidatus Desantisbacteria bacterium CG_4_10_14_0_8_um_filter_48_22]